MILKNSSIKPHALLNLLRLMCQAQLTYFPPLDILKHFNDLFLNHVYVYVYASRCHMLKLSVTCIMGGGELPNIFAIN